MSSRVSAAALLAMLLAACGPQVPEPIRRTAVLELTAAAAGSRQVDLAWKLDAAVLGWDELRLERRDGEAAGWLQIHAIPFGKTRTFTDVAGLVPATAYAYRLRTHFWSGELADSNEATATTVIRQPLTGVVMIAAGGEQSYAVTAKEILAWGRNDRGQLGVAAAPGNVPIAIPSFSGRIKRPQLAAGRGHALAILSGQLSCWGDNEAGQLGVEADEFRHAPEVLRMEEIAMWVAGGAAHTLAIDEAGTVYAAGSNSDGQLGMEGVSTRRSLVPVLGAPPSQGLAAGAGHSLALSSGRVFAWGGNAQGQLGKDGGGSLHVPTEIAGLSGVTAVAAGDFHSLALAAGGEVWAWGANDEGQLGLDDAASIVAAPRRIPGLSSVIRLAAGGAFSLALLADGTVWGWGTNAGGELGRPELQLSRVPLRIAGLSGIREIAAGARHALALDAEGRLQAWGMNGQGQLGDESADARLAPVRVLSP